MGPIKLKIYHGTLDTASAPRDNLYRAIRDVIAPNTNPRLLPNLYKSHFIQILLSCVDDLNPEINIVIFLHVQKYIIATRRFSVKKLPLGASL